MDNPIFMQLEVLKVWLENSEELATLLKRDRIFRDTYEAIKTQGFKPWLKDQIKDGANPIDLYIKTEHYIHDCIPTKATDAIREVFWDTLNTLDNEHTNHAEKGQKTP